MIINQAECKYIAAMQVSISIFFGLVSKKAELRKQVNELSTIKNDLALEVMYM